jgi:hypothetical protein
MRHSLFDPPGITILKYAAEQAGCLFYDYGANRLTHQMANAVEALVHIQDQMNLAKPSRTAFERLERAESAAFDNLHKAGYITTGR